MVTRGMQALQESPILLQMRDYLGETVLESVLMAEVKDDLPEKKSTVSVPGGPVVNVQMWMSLSEDMPETCCNLLYRLLSTDMAERQYAKVIAKLFHVKHHVVTSCGHTLCSSKS